MNIQIKNEIIATVILCSFFFGFTYYRMNRENNEMESMNIMNETIIEPIPHVPENQQESMFIIENDIIKITEKDEPIEQNVESNQLQNATTTDSQLSLNESCVDINETSDKPTSISDLIMNTFEEYNIEDICKLAIIVIETIQITYFIIIFVKQFCAHFFSVVFDLIIIKIFFDIPQIVLIVMFIKWIIAFLLNKKSKNDQSTNSE